jgi:branched-chain amino acid transport system substrate-binding protein
VIEAMKKADSTDPAKFTPEIFNDNFVGATGTVQFDAKGDRKDAEMTIFKLQGGKVVPIAIVKNGQTTPFVGGSSGNAVVGGPAPAAAPATAAPAAPATPAPAEPKKEEAKKDEKKK